MNVFFDNCTSPTLAATLDGYLRHTGQRAVHIRFAADASLKLAHDAGDIDWVMALAADPREWAIVTGDRRIARNKAEKEAFRRARVKGLWLSGRFTRLAINRQAALLINRWPELSDTLSRFNPPVLIGVPTSFGGKLDLIRW